MRAVERKVLLEALAGQLPEGTIRFKSRVTSIKESDSTTGVTDIQLQDGSIYSAKVRQTRFHNSKQHIWHFIICYEQVWL